MVLRLCLPHHEPEGKKKKRNILLFNKPSYEIVFSSNPTVFYGISWNQNQSNRNNQSRRRKIGTRSEWEELKEIHVNGLKRGKSEWTRHDWHKFPPDWLVHVLRTNHSASFKIAFSSLRFMNYHLNFWENWSSRRKALKRRQESTTHMTRRDLQ